ncbi:MAG TPA: hypothetical protein VFX98_04115 [Longimicrobiaceae bacterium]|nr:hypothetical protein [Longimicrobiaceae bacterium]
MPAPRLTVPIEPVREAVRRAVEASNFRAVAAQVGMSHGGLFRFLGGTVPRASTVRKLLRWYTLHAAATRDWGPDETAARAALAVLVDGLGGPARERAAAELLHTLRRLYREAHAPLPAWLERGG